MHTLAITVTTLRSRYVVVNPSVVCPSVCLSVMFVEPILRGLNFSAIFVLTEFTNVTDRPTDGRADGQTPHGGIALA